MNARPLNLLRYPRRVHPLAPRQLRDLLWAGVAGALIGGLWCIWLDTEKEQLQQERTHLQAQATAWREQQSRERALEQKAKLQWAWTQRAQAWQGQRQKLARLHGALDTLALETGLRAERWQGDGRKLLLQAWLPEAASVPMVLSGLSGAWEQGWTLQSMGDRTGGGVALVLQSAWLTDSVDDAQPKP